MTYCCTRGLLRAHLDSARDRHCVLIGELEGIVDEGHLGIRHLAWFLYHDVVDVAGRTTGGDTCTAELVSVDVNECQ